MAALTKAMCVVLIAAVLVAAVAPAAEAAVGCDMVIAYFTSCLPYLTNQEYLDSVCCFDVRHLYVGRSTADRQAICVCLKSLIGSDPDISPSKVDVLPFKCGVGKPYNIRPSTNCSTVQEVNLVRSEESM